MADAQQLEYVMADKKAHLQEDMVRKVHQREADHAMEVRESSRSKAAVLFRVLLPLLTANVLVYAYIHNCTPTYSTYFRVNYTSSIFGTISVKMSPF